MIIHPKRDSLRRPTPSYGAAFAALSISRAVREWLDAGRFDGRVLTVFDRACDLLTHDGDVVALVTPQVGDGPLNVVVDGPPGLFATVETGAPAHLEERQLQIGALRFDLERAMIWEPRPDWERLRARRTAVRTCLPLLRTLCARHAPPRSLLGLLGSSLPEDVPARAIFSTARVAAAALQEGWAGDHQRLREGIVGLAGLGLGLTPAGDDFLVGAMLRAWLDHPTPKSLCRSVVRDAIPRTTRLSAAFLKAASRGECGASWHVLLKALSRGAREGAEAEITMAVHEILIHGATSGADSLAGFILRQA